MANESYDFLPPNSFKAALKNGRPQIGIWSSLCSNIVAEVLAGAGFDWILIDAEHGPNEIPGILSQLQAMTGGTAEPVVRCPWNDFVWIKRVLDIGARSILVPYVQSADEARKVVAATRYPTAGIRGVCIAPRANRYGRVAGYHAKADDEMCVLVQVETRPTVEKIETIADVEGVDGIFVGPMDLAASCGHLGNPQHPEVQAMITEACKRIRAKGKAAGIISGNPDEAAYYLDLGFNFVAVGADLGVLTKGTEALAAKFKKLVAEKRMMVVG